MFSKLKNILFRYIIKKSKPRRFVVMRYCSNFFDLYEEGDTGCFTSLYEMKGKKLYRIANLNENYYQDRWKENLILDIHALAKKEAKEDPYTLSFSESFSVAPDNFD